jgi:non-canonical (house-cleaning) NTP pyrophosphatase
VSDGEEVFLNVGITDGIHDGESVGDCVGEYVGNTETGYAVGSVGIDVGEEVSIGPTVYTA